MLLRGGRWGTICERQPKLWFLDTTSRSSSVFGYRQMPLFTYPSNHVILFMKMISISYLWGFVRCGCTVSSQHRLIQLHLFRQHPIHPLQSIALLPSVSPSALPSLFVSLATAVEADQHQMPWLALHPLASSVYPLLVLYRLLRFPTLYPWTLPPAAVFPYAPPFLFVSLTEMEADPIQMV